MARVKRAVHSKKKHKAVLEQAQGYYGDRSRTFKSANEAVMHAGNYAFRDRRARKGQFRRLWIQRINAACRQHGTSYSVFIAGLKNAGVEGTARSSPTWRSLSRRRSPPWSSWPPRPTLPDRRFPAGRREAPWIRRSAGSSGSAAR